MANNGDVSPRGVGENRVWIVLTLSAMGLMADVYDFTIINLIRPSLEAEFGKLTPRQDSMLTGAALVGAVFGQVGFGIIADHIGRRKIFISTAALVAFASLASAMAPRNGPFGLEIYGILIFFRFLMGLGIGGEYPLAAATIAENVDSESSSKAFASVLFGMAFGLVLGPTVLMLLLAQGIRNENTWRLCLGFGAVLGGLCTVLRCRFLWETHSWQQATVGSSTTSANHGEKLSALWAMRWSMLGTAGSWFFYDIVTYGVNLFSTEIFPAAPGWATAKIVLTFNACGAIPGLLVAIVLSSKVRMRHLQLAGLGGMFICFVLLGVLYPMKEKLPGVYLVLFTFQRAFDSMGPTVTAFTVPGQIYPTRIRATAHGVSAAAGKIGAVVGTIVFPYLNAAMGLQAVMNFMSLACAVTAVWTMIFVPLYGNDTLEEIARHDKESLADQSVIAERALHSSDARKGEAMHLKGKHSEF